MKLMRLILLCVFIFVSGVWSASELDFSKKRNYFLGEGEFGSVSFQLKSAETYNFESGISKPFVLKKLNNNGLIQVIFDARTMEASDLTDGKTFTTSFVFTKKNIGKKELLNVSAIYRPELRFVTSDSLFMDFVKLDFTPDNRTFTLKINSLKKISDLVIDDPKNLIKFGEDDKLSLEKGINEITVTLNAEDNFSEEVQIYRKLNEGKINQLYFLVSAKNFKSVSTETETGDVTEEEVRQMMLEDSLEQAGLYSDMQDTSANGGSGDSYPMFSLMSLIVIAFMALIVLILIILIVLRKKDPLFDTYQTFFDDVATLTKIPVKGVNLDKSIEEIMMILLEKFEYGQEEKKQTETKRVLKKPAGIKTPPGLEKKTEEKSVSIDLNFNDVQNDQQAPEPEKPATSSGEKKISRGFDFLDED